jgi:RHS repeat-associated protein
MGRLTSDTLRSYSWDMASRLTSYSGADGSMTATYDGLGQRISAAQSSGNLNFVWNYATPLASLATVADASGDRRYYVYAPDGTLLYGIDAAGNARHFYHFDETGSTVLLTDDTGAVTDSYAIGAYGESVVHTGSTDNPFTWQGQFGVMQEASTGLYYMRARYYDSTSARFISPDPIASLNPLAMSPYQYAFADPVGNSDPSGLDPNLATIIVGATDTPLLPGPLVSVGPLWPSQDNFSGIVGKHTLKFGFDPRQFQVDNPFFTTVPLLGAPQFGDDATVAARLRAAGAVILGKTNLSEWANFRSSPQGSFSGIPVFPAIPLPGSRGRTVADAAAVLSALVGVDPRDPATAVTARFSTDYTQFLNPATTPIVTFYPKPGQLLAPFVTPGSPSNVVGRPTASAYYSYFSYYAAYYAYYGSSDYWGDWYYGH